MAVAAVEFEAEIEIGHECPQCGGTRLRQQLVKSAFWHGERLVAVEGIPALVCEACGERFYDDATVAALDLLQGDGFPAAAAIAHVEVPVFSFAGRVPDGPAEAGEGRG